ncbi:hypothetical protein GCM10009838_23330 [Catenulispora subtropica]|uniref:Uncharacterized protein n=1 Tax=Catenulispora subtropica TaxID=450798 RepID=A0ABN2R8K6_9ACTN
MLDDSKGGSRSTTASASKAGKATPETTEQPRGCSRARIRARGGQHRSAFQHLSRELQDTKSVVITEHSRRPQPAD